MFNLNANDVLIVDIDGTLTPANTLKLLRFRYHSRHPSYLRQLAAWRAKSKQWEKVELWNHVPFTRRPPLNHHVVEFVRKWAAAGGRVHVVSGSATGLAEYVSRSAGLTCRVTGSTADVNMTKKNKADFIRSEYAQHRVTYIGDSKDDFSVWKICQRAVAVGWTSEEALMIETVSGEAPVLLPGIPVKEWIGPAFRLTVF